MTNVLYHGNATDFFVFKFTDGREEDVVKQASDFAVSENINFNWQDYQSVVQQIDKKKKRQGS